MSDNLIPLCEPSISGNAGAYVQDCLDTGWVSSVGGYVNRFEEMMAQAADTGHAIAATSGTAALHLCLLAAKIGPGDKVLVPDMTFVATVNAVKYVGAKPVFVAPTTNDWHMDVGAIETYLGGGGEATAILPAHLLGGCADMDPLLKLAAKYDLTVIEDAAEGLGATYKSRKVGGMGKLGAFSFNGNKMITTGGGGMVVTNDADLAARTRHLSTQAKRPGAEYQFDDVGYNYRLTNVQAAMGCAQMEVLSDHVAKKCAIAETYNQAFADVPGVKLMPVPDHTDCAWWMYTVLIDEAEFGMSSRDVMQALSEKKMITRPLWQPLHEAPMYRSAAVIGDVGVSKILYDLGLSLPCSVTLTDDQQHRVIAAIKDLAP